jgi:hypothetical protein
MDANAHLERRLSGPIRVQHPGLERLARVDGLRRVLEDGAHAISKALEDAARVGFDGRLNDLIVQPGRETHPFWGSFPHAGASFQIGKQKRNGSGR